MLTEQAIVNHFADYIAKNGGNASEWYTGIASKPQERLEQHKALDSKFIYDNALSNDIARAVESHMTKIIKTKGGKGVLNSTWVYCYKITPTTNQDA